jgi:hypothetical protein
MAKLRDQQAEWEWPTGLATFDPDKWGRAAWHLARAHAAPSKLVALQEIRASLGTPDAGGGGGVVIVEPPARGAR